MAQATLERIQQKEHRIMKGAGERQDLDCLIELRPDDPLTGIQYRDCIIDYSRCPNQHCIKKLQ